ncbi:hypothetical protein LuPra_03809 [Luteitalea pratensis]|uniref:Uncharacterized protein n=1 Tax=Luteitalea pratensis TaxID=1855912 RepID=A0A143PQZ2_LUTPR|nr:hypothetical protein [Luteitalea pratensis]AMY10573.1 hypothetical protein LuPra_03809 [Luteitalea pratensis]
MKPVCDAQGEPLTASAMLVDALRNADVYRLMAQCAVDQLRVAQLALAQTRADYQRVLEEFRRYRDDHGVR